MKKMYILMKMMETIMIMKITKIIVKNKTMIGNNIILKKWNIIY